MPPLMRIFACKKMHAAMQITIRESRDDDRSALRELITAAFEPVAESDHCEQELVERLQASEAFVPALSLVAATPEGILAGYILLSKVEIRTATGSVPSLGVAPLAVHPRYQRQGIGGQLLEEAHRRAARLGYGSALLLGHEKYYPRFGYRQAADFGIAFPFDAPAECCMAIELHPHALRSVRGTVRYPGAFFL